MLFKMFVSASLFISLSTCGTNIVENPAQSESVQGLKPLYAQLSAESIYTDVTQPVGKLQSFVVFRDYLLVTERDRGIHVLDNTDPEDPVGKCFWHIPGIRNFTIANNNLLVPVGSRLVTIDVSDVDNVFLRSIQEDFFEDADTNVFPEGYVGSFECVDNKQGVVIGWEETQLDRPKCWR